MAEEAVTGGDKLREMKRAVLVLLAAILVDSPLIHATSCSVPPPCGRIREGSIFFVGTALDSGVADGPGRDAIRATRVQVDESFIGLPPNAKEVVVAEEGAWIVKGHAYLFDAGRGKDGRYYLKMCGASGELNGEYVASVLDFLRQRAKGNVKTSLTVSVSGNYQPLSEAQVTVDGPGGPFKGTTDGRGLAKFEDIQPGRYHVTASRDNYRADEERVSDSDQTVVSGSCPQSYVHLESQASLSGRLRDAQGAPVASLKLELIAFTNDPKPFVQMGKFFTATTTEDGTFRFDSVVPGRYLLGSNIIGLNSSTMPPTYYPGRAERDGAVPIDVETGANVGGLEFMLPDFGSMREIKICVVDDAGSPVTGAGVGVSFFNYLKVTASLGEHLVTGQQGCVTTKGYARLSYPINASYRPAGADFRQIRGSETVEITPGEEPIVKVLHLGKPFGSPKPQ